MLFVVVKKSTKNAIRKKRNDYFQNFQPAKAKLHTKLISISKKIRIIMMAA